ncbi:MAG: hypothetical protein MUC65_03960 [Pontiellaceae bacterium]|nr:hypothetical protein [Pontiellaceae bacterium]
MNIKKTIKLCSLGFAAAAGMAAADVFHFTSPGADQNWTNVTNWVCIKEREDRVLPGNTDQARIDHVAVRITTAVTVGYLRSGVGGPGTVIIDGGSLVTVGPGKFSSASYNSPAIIIVTNGGSALFNFYFMVGCLNYPEARMEIYDGTVRVSGTYYHVRNYAAPDPMSTRTVIHEGGLLEVDVLELNAGVLDIAGGKVIVRRSRADQISQWVAEGRIVAMGGAAGWAIKAVLDPETNYTVLVAEPSAAPLSVGMRSPVPSCFGKEKRI